jgi:hypothetical protein
VRPSRSASRRRGPPGAAGDGVPARSRNHAGPLRRAAHRTLRKRMRVRSVGVAIVRLAGRHLDAFRVQFRSGNAHPKPLPMSRGTIVSDQTVTCWIGRTEPATTREHRIKHSDLRALFDKPGKGLAQAPLGLILPCTEAALKISAGGVHRRKCGGRQ